jgi:prepilin-type N-terminal cleavage/methylation domain-containing protein
MRAARDDRGFSLVEVLAAMLVLATGAMGMAGLVTLSAAATRSARDTTSASLFALDKIEQLRSLTWDYDNAGVPVSDVTTDLSAQPPTFGGAGLTPSPSDSLDRNVPGYVDFLDAGGRWVGAGSAPPRTAVFVRRWRIAPMSANPLNTLVFQVRVTPVGRNLRAQDALLTAVRTRSVS